MPAQRTKPTNARAGPGPSSSTAASARPAPAHKIPALERRTDAGLPGISKLKAQIRQTKRLLAKDTLEPALRIATQRRLAALEADLARAGARDVAKRNGAKYHAVKFFERQKCARAIKKAARELAALDAVAASASAAVGSGEADGKKGKKAVRKREKAEKRLEDARVFLNYVLHYPNAVKYISLFPSSISDPAAADPDAESTESAPLPAYLDADPATLDGPARARYDRLAEVRRLMRAGLMSARPEAEGRGAGIEGVGAGAGAGAALSSVFGEGRGEGSAKGGREGKSRAGKAVPEAEVTAEIKAEDDFFDND
ncbi:18S rRNA maturation protein [Cryptotrichosporon argae]